MNESPSPTPCLQRRISQNLDESISPTSKSSSPAKSSPSPAKRPPQPPKPPTHRSSTSVPTRQPQSTTNPLFIPKLIPKLRKPISPPRSPLPLQQRIPKRIRPPPTSMPRRPPRPKRIIPRPRRNLRVEPTMTTTTTSVRTAEQRVVKGRVHPPATTPGSSGPPKVRDHRVVWAQAGGV